ncbi:MAG: FmdB family zinc ribbon protein [Armatimonadota bacterium]
MPLFEFMCNNCKKKFAQLVGMTADSKQPRCKYCNSEDISKLISRFRKGVSEDDYLDSLEDKALSMDMDDPRSASRFMKEMSKELADEADDEDIEEFVAEAEKELYDGSNDDYAIDDE